MFKLTVSALSKKELPSNCNFEFHVLNFHTLVLLSFLLWWCATATIWMKVKHRGHSQGRKGPGEVIGRSIDADELHQVRRDQPFQCLKHMAGHLTESTWFPSIQNHNWKMGKVFCNICCKNLTFWGVVWPTHYSIFSFSLFCIWAKDLLAWDVWAKDFCSDDTWPNFFYPYSLPYTFSI